MATTAKREHNKHKHKHKHRELTVEDIQLLEGLCMSDAIDKTSKQRAEESKRAAHTPVFAISDNVRAQCTEEQLAAIQSVSRGYLTMVVGQAGTGKSTIIRALRECVGNHNHTRNGGDSSASFEGALRLVVTAPTGTAASKIRGETLHSRLWLPRCADDGTRVFDKQQRAFFKAADDPANSVHKELRACMDIDGECGLDGTLTIWVIDEVFMLPRHVINMICNAWKRIGRAHGRRARTFVIMCGDPCQLPPVTNCTKMSVRAGHAHKPVPRPPIYTKQQRAAMTPAARRLHQQQWQEYKEYKRLKETVLPIQALCSHADHIVVLTRNFRQLAAEHASVMCDVRQGRLTEHSKQFLEKRALDAAELKARNPGITVLTATREQANMYTKMFETNLTAMCKPHPRQGALIEAFADTTLEAHGVSGSCMEQMKRILHGTLRGKRQRMRQPVVMHFILRKRAPARRKAPKAQPSEAPPGSQRTRTPSKKRPRMTMERIDNQPALLARLDYLMSGYVHKPSDAQTFETLVAFDVENRGCCPQAIVSTVANMLNKQLPIRQNERLVTVGMPIRLTNNLCVRKGCTNGTPGLVVGFLPADHPPLVWGDLIREARKAHTQQEKERPTGVPCSIQWCKVWALEKLEAIAHEYADAGRLCSVGSGAPVVWCGTTKHDDGGFLFALPFLHIDSGPLTFRLPKRHSSEHANQVWESPEAVLVRLLFRPLMPAPACTVYRFQGAEVPALIVDLKGIRQAAEAYVALSRVQNLDRLRIVRHPVNHPRPLPSWGMHLDTIYAHREAAAFDTWTTNEATRRQRQFHREMKHVQESQASSTTPPDLWRMLCIPAKTAYNAINKQLMKNAKQSAQLDTLKRKLTQL